jgi:hypothetical protein
LATTVGVTSLPEDLDFQPKKVWYNMASSALWALPVTGARRPKTGVYQSSLRSIDLPDECVLLVADPTQGSQNAHFDI